MTTAELQQRISTVTGMVWDAARKPGPDLTGLGLRRISEGFVEQLVRDAVRSWRPGPADDLTGMLLAVLREPADGAALHALADCLTDRIQGLPPVERLVLKPLEWRQLRPADHEDGEWWTVETVFGQIDVEHDPGTGYRWRYCFDEYYDEGTHDCESVEDGKRAAEAFYRERLAPFLEGKE